MNLLLTGCTGFIGRELIPSLLKAGHQLTVISRKDQPKFPCNQYKEVKKVKLDLSSEKNQEIEKLTSVLKQVEGVIHLAGEPIAEKRWTKAQQDLIFNSRMNSTKCLINAMNKLKVPPKVFINGSAVGYYGTNRNLIFNEKSSAGSDFLADVCKKWESIAQEKPINTRLVILRIGIVLEKDGGALGKMLPIFKTGFGGPLGDGQQWMSWIHRTDICEIIQRALIEKSWEGPINAVSPHALCMKDFAKCLGDSLGRPSLLPVPSTVLRLLLGDGAKVVLEGQKVKPSRLEKLNYKFKYPEITAALAAITKSQPK